MYLYYHLSAVLPIAQTGDILVKVRHRALFSRPPTNNLLPVVGRLCLILYQQEGKYILFGVKPVY